MDLMEVLKQICVPRPSGSAAVESVRATLDSLLQSTGLSVSQEPFILRAHMPAIVGLTLFILAVGVFIAMRSRRFGVALLLAVLIPVVYLAEYERNVPIVSWIGQRPAYNIVADWSPAGPEPSTTAAPAASSPDTGETPAGERPLVILGAHYDAKTEVFDHNARKPIYSTAPIAMVALILVSLIGLAATRLGFLRFFNQTGGRVALMVVALAATAAIALLTFSFTGGYLVSAKSPGARDDGTSVAVLAGLAADLPSLGLQSTDVRLILFNGEEVNCQGSAAYVEAHPELAQAVEGGRAVYVINLECLSGQGTLGYQGSSGWFLKSFPASGEVTAYIDGALAETGKPPLWEGPFSYDDARNFMAAGIPAATIFEGDPDRPDSYHNSGDSLDKVKPGEMDNILAALEGTLRLIDQETLAGQAGAPGGQPGAVQPAGSGGGD